MSPNQDAPFVSPQPAVPSPQPAERGPQPADQDWTSNRAPWTVDSGLRTAGGDRPRPTARQNDTWFFVELLRRRWLGLAAGGLVCAGAACAWSSRHWIPCYIASARVIRADSARASQVFAFQTFTPQTYVSLLRSPELLAQVAAKAQPAMSDYAFSRRLRISPEHDGDVVLVETSGATKQAAADLANLYVREAIRFTKQLQSRAAEEVKSFIQPQLAEVNSEVADVKTNSAQAAQLPTKPPPPALQHPTATALKLEAAREELVDALTRYTDLHPTVQRMKAKVAALEQLVVQEKTNPTAPSEAEVADRLAMQRDARENLRNQMAPLEATRRDLLIRYRSADLVATDPPGYYRELAPATLRDVRSTKREVKIGSLTVLGGVLGTLGALGLTLLIQFLDQRLKAAADVKRVTGLPVIASAPDLTDRCHSERENWAFRTWITLQGLLSPAPNHGLVCGLTSAAHGEGRSLWIKLLAHAASECGYRVLTVTAEHSLPASELSTDARPRPRINGNGHLVAAGHHDAPNADVPTRARTFLSAAPTPFPRSTTSSTSSLGRSPSVSCRFPCPVGCGTWSGANNGNPPSRTGSASTTSSSWWSCRRPRSRKRSCSPRNCPTCCGSPTAPDRWPPKRAPNLRPSVTPVAAWSARY